MTVDDLWREYRLPELVAKYDELSTGLCYAWMHGMLARDADPDNPRIADAVALIERQRDECTAVWEALASQLEPT